MRLDSVKRSASLMIGLAMSLMLMPLVWTPMAYGQPSIARDITAAQKRAVKIYGAGGSGGLEAYQSGFLVSPLGHIATAWSYVLDVDPIVVLADGRRFESKIVGFEPALELAVLKIEDETLQTESLPHFTVGSETASEIAWGDPVYAISNLFGIAAGAEPASVMQGRVAALAKLDARRGTFQTPYRGEVFLLDLVANNPGAAGGALVDAAGNLVGMLGKELRDRGTGAWLNYAIPAKVLRRPIGDIIAGRKTTLPDTSQPKLARDQSHSVQSLGIGLVPDVMETTPVFVDFVEADSPADQAGLRVDDLILLVDGQRTAHQRALRDRLRRIDRRDDVALVVQRGSEILQLVIKP